ncbi:hypothetical protein DEU56DRAFT_963243 [Suillus clintonianus]|uniref:uncharacterized protein n=1 Tax=Suillus clintonianus TaxID=1904413 RepID=UPI001B880695|nr:uncharacterized protein DEU56DRAFT_963243 [Suillus clintonianus]KAG2124899.1 hypothetical protein DEU56DRAFT_963243 [Suillus clintonianus]
MPNPQGKNGRGVVSPPDAIIRPLVEQYVANGYSNQEIISRLRAHQETSKFNISGELRPARGQAHTIESIGPAIESGSHDMKQTLRQEEHLMVPRDLILRYMNLHHPDEVQRRKSRRLKRSTFWTAGLHDIWVFDQHDKWRRFQLFLHVGIEPFSGRILWLKIWWTNHNPRLICGWYCDTVQSLGAMPLVTQSDPGTENNGIANGHTMLRHLQDPGLARTLQHKFRGDHRNIKPEIFWSQLRCRWTPGFEDILDFGLSAGIYNPDDALERLVFHFVFIPWLQHELDLFADKFNNTKPRFNMHKILPHGRPNDIFDCPEKFDCRDFSVSCQTHSCPYINEVRKTYAPSDHPVFLLVPQEFSQQATAFMSELGHTVLTRDNIWDVYSGLLMCFRAIEGEDPIRSVITAQPKIPCDGEKLIGSEEMDVLDLPPFVEGAGYRVPTGESAAVNSSDEESDFYEFTWTDEEAI